MVSRTFVLYIFGLLAVALALAFPSIALLSPFTFALICPLGIIWLWKSQGRSFGDLGYRLCTHWLRYLAIGLFFGLAIPVLFQVIEALGGWIKLSPTREPVANLLSFWPEVFLTLALIVAMEEFVFRGFFFQALSQRTGVRLAAVLSSLLWGSSHLTSMVNKGLTPGSIMIGMASFLGWGIALSLGYLKAEKSLWLSYGLHLGINLGFNLAGWLFITQPNAPTWWIGDPAWSSVTGLFGMSIWLILAAVIYWLTGHDKINSLTAVMH